MTDRETRGLDIAKHASIEEREDGSFSVPSQTNREVSYVVKVIGQTWACDCPDFVNRADRIDSCKHVFGVRFWIASKVELRNEPKPKVFAEDSVQCPKCGSIRVVKFGNYNEKQLYKCKDCRTKFREGLLKKTKYTPETITLTLDLYFSGLSLRKIARTLNGHFDLTLGATTIYDWIQKFVPMISEYANNLAPKLSETWHADELFVKMKGGIRTKSGQENMAFVWNVLDRETRFLLASKLSSHRSIIGATNAFNEAKKNAHGSRPERIYADAHPSYPVGLANAFGSDTPQLIAKAGVRKPHANNNRIERLNGTLRERVKVQRGWKTMGTPLAEGQRLHYNFVKPHQALDGKTPAQVAGIGVQGENKWLSLLKAALADEGGLGGNSS